MGRSRFKIKKQLFNASHFPIFDKLQLIEQRAQTIVEYFTKVYGLKAESAAKRRLFKICSSREALSEKKRKGNWAATFEFLGRQLDKAKVEEAKLIRSLLDKYGQSAVKLMKTASYEFGKKVGLGVPLEIEALSAHLVKIEIRRFKRGKTFFVDESYQLL